LEGEDKASHSGYDPILGDAFVSMPARTWPPDRVKKVGLHGNLLLGAAGGR
jgi:hypothetical protein